MSKPVFDSVEKFCKICKSKDTYINKKNGQPVWYYAEPGFLCKKCYRLVSTLQKMTIQYDFY